MRNRIKPLAEKKGLRRPCSICNNTFQPTGSQQKLCEDCQKKSIRGYNAKYLRLKKEKDEKTNK